MKLSITVQGNVPDYLAKKALQYPKATSSALNKMAAQVKTKASTLVRAEITASKASVDKTFKIRSATPQRLEAALISSGRNMSLVPFGASQTAGGVTISNPGTFIKSGYIPHAFIATMASGRVGVFLRRSSAHRRPSTQDGRIRDLPIFQITAPSVPTLMKSSKIWPQLQSLITEKLPALVAHEIEFFGR